MASFILRILIVVLTFAYGSAGYVKLGKDGGCTHTHTKIVVEGYETTITEFLTISVTPVLTTVITTNINTKSTMWFRGLLPATKQSPLRLCPVCLCLPCISPNPQSLFPQELVRRLSLKQWLVHPFLLDFFSQPYLRAV